MGPGQPCFKFCVGSCLCIMANNRRLVLVCAECFVSSSATSGMCFDYMKLNWSPCSPFIMFSEWCL